MTSEITIKKTTLWQGIAGILFLLLLASIFTGGFGLFGKEPIQQQQLPPQQQDEELEEPEPFDTSQWDLSDEPMLGKENAPVEIIEFSDFECPFCSRASNGPVKQVIEKYVETGKAKLYFRHFPLGFHANAQIAAEATECANEQGLFWELHDKIFDNQANLNKENILVWADEVGINVAELTTCMDSGKYAAEVNEDMTFGQKAGISGTPSFLINGRLVVGAQPFEVFKQIIEEEL